MERETAALVRSDPTSLAGAAWRAADRGNRRNNRDRIIVRALAAGLTLGLLAAAILYFWGDPWDGALIAVLCAAVGTVAVATFAMRGVVALLLIIVCSAAVAVWAAWGTLNWGGMVAGVALPALGGLAAGTARRTRVPRMTAAACICAITPVLYLLLASLIGEWVVPAAVVGTAAGVAAQIDLNRLRLVRAAARRSGIPMDADGPFTSSLLGVRGPGGADSAELHSRAEAQRRTAELLEQLPAGWFVFHSRVTVLGEAVDHVVVGPPGVVVIRSEEAPYRITEVAAPSPDGFDGLWTTVAVDGAPAGPGEHTEVCRCAAAVDEVLMTPGGRRTTLAVFVTHDADVEHGHISRRIAVNGVVDLIEYVAPPMLLPLLTGLPSLGRGPQFTEDLAAVVDYLMPLEQ